MRAMLGAPFEVTAVARVGDAVHTLRDGEFHAVVFDISLPGAAGLDGLRRIQEAAERVPVVIVSDEGDDELAIAAVAAGAHDHLPKGHVTGISLARALRYAMERQELCNRLADSLGELERQRANVVDLNESKNHLIAVLAHDIKGPLTSIVGFAELLEEGYLEGDGATDAAKTIRNNAQRLATFANDVVALSRVEHGNLELAGERVNLVEVIEKVIESKSGERALEFQSDSGEAFVRGDTGRLRQVFEHLIGNAIRYSPGGEPVEVALRSGGGAYAIAIRDRGIGVPEEELPKLFGRFSRASNGRKAKLSGTGTGLFIVKRIVELHGGTVAVTTKPGDGSTFTVTLPAMEAMGEAQSGRVTILSSSPHLSRFAAYELRSRGYRVREIDTLEELDASDGFRAGDVVVADAHDVNPRTVRDLIGSAGIRLVGIGALDEGWDAALPRPFLLSDLLAAITGERQPAASQ